MDLGVSSPQLEEANRGFSFQVDGPLDMRMDPTTGESAAEWVARADTKEIAHVLWVFGEERFSRRIARAIVEARSTNRFKRPPSLGRLAMPSPLRIVTSIQRLALFKLSVYTLTES